MVPPGRRRGQDESHDLPTAEPVPESFRRNLPVLRDSDPQVPARKSGSRLDGPSIDLRDDYGGNWLSRGREVRSGYVKAWQDHPQKGLFIDVRA